MMLCTRQSWKERSKWKQCRRKEEISKRACLLHSSSWAGFPSTFHVPPVPNWSRSYVLLFVMCDGWETELERDEAAAKKRKTSNYVGGDSMKSSGIRFMEEAMERKQAEEDARRRFMHQTFIVRVKWIKNVGGGEEEKEMGEEECKKMFNTYHPVRTTVKGSMALVEFDTIEAAVWIS
jgi:hypothetical protein